MSGLGGYETPQLKRLIGDIQYLIKPFKLKFLAVVYEDTIGNQNLNKTYFTDPNT